MFKMITFFFLCLILIQNYLPAKCESECNYGTDKGVSYADCSKRFLTKFPINLKANVEVGINLVWDFNTWFIMTISYRKGLYLSWNFIRLLRNDTFLHYSSIKYLYLDQNPALEIESFALAPLTKLNVLDLSHNRYLNISKIFLPTSLKKLYLSGITTITTQLPISSLHELNYLTLSECELNQIPSFGGNLHSLEALNLTANKLENIKIDNLAFLCQLKKLYISHDVSIRNKCECLKIKKWTQDKEITGSVFSCSSSKSLENCDTSPPASFLKLYESCKTDVMAKKFLSWFLIGCAVFGACFSCVILYVCCHRKGLFCDVVCCRCCRKKSRRK